MKNVKKYSSGFDGLLRKIVSKEPFVNQEKSYINVKGEMKFSTVSDYLKEFFSIIEIYKKCVTYEKNGRHQLD